MSQLRPNHRCQIDCTNHDEVITALELKSKDLYYFWRNYQWLYARYQQLLLKQRQVQQTPKQPEVIKEIVKVKQNHDKCNKQIQDLQNANQKLTKQNKKLRMDLQSCKKQIYQLQNNNKYETEYKKQITFLKNKNTQIQAIKDKQHNEINKLKNTLKSMQEQWQGQRAKLMKENKRLTQTIIELQQSIDQFRSRPSNPISTSVIHKQQGPSLLQIQQFKSKQTSILTSKLRNLSQEAEKLISQQCESMRRQFQQKFQDLFYSLTSSELQSIIQVRQE